MLVYASVIKVFESGAKTNKHYAKANLKQRVLFTK